jgi:DNA-binding transcriptional LysR family regulator
MALDSFADLATFVQILEAGSFTAAARRQGLTVNAVSRRLQQLEEGLGIKLIERTTRRLTPTDAGRRLHQRASSILELLIEAEADVVRSRSEVEGLVRIAMPSAAITPLLLAELRDTSAKHPALRLDLRVGAPHLPGEAGVDVAIVAERPPPTLNLLSRRIGLKGWGLAAAPSYVAAHGLPKRPEDLSDHACLRFVGAVPQRTWTLTGPGGKRVIVPVNGAFECDDSRILGDAAYVGLGIGVRAESEITAAVARRELVHVLPGWRFGAVPVWLLTTTARRELPRVATVTAVLDAALRRLG